MLFARNFVQTAEDAEDRRGQEGVKTPRIPPRSPESSAVPSPRYLLLLLLFAAWHGLSANADGPAAPPELTIANARELLGKQATFEFDVAAVKFAKRRQMHFLSPAGNFRGAGTISVAVRDADFESFRRAGIESLEKQFAGQAVRATGKVIEDEGQVLLLVDSPANLRRADAVEVATHQELIVVNEDGQSKTFPLPLPERFTRRDVTVEHEGEKETYRGVPLEAILAQSGVVLGKEARGKLVARYVLVTAADGYRVVLSLAEVDSLYGERNVILAESLDGQPLKGNARPLQLVVPADTPHRRWARQVMKIEVRNAP